MTQANLTLRYSCGEDDGRLTATARSQSFSGTGSAWIGFNSLGRFADELAAFPIDPDRPPRLVAGSYRDGKLLENREFVSVIIRPFDRTGKLVAQIWLGETGFDHRRENPAMGQAVRVAFLVQYQALSDFALALRALEDGSTPFAELSAAIP
jgi:hypothetical protein